MSSVRLGRPTGRNFTGGLPPSPRARSVGHNDVRERDRETKEYKASRTRESDYSSPRHNTGASSTRIRAPPTRSVRPQRSAASILPSRGESSLYADVPEVPPLPLPRRSDASSSASSGSYSSASGSLLDRMKGRREYGYGYGSSRTSFEDEADPPPPPRKVMGPERGGRWLSQRERAAANMPESEYGTFTELRLWVAAACLMHCILFYFFQAKWTMETSCCQTSQAMACRSGRASQRLRAP